VTGHNQRTLVGIALGASRFLPVAIVNSKGSAVLKMNQNVVTL